ncbi:hypothetical protein VCR31J2_2260081 [Vibrio coralliirubri]|uniref:Uncharacterized protein n=1 Tax=Vibrio coralliirubri TaxID=1516159 RepID=A0AA86XWV4_9VIBR|nr:hypothetical protein VCR31J2_2260081 [Vibrio coralliirubri]
MRNSKIWKEQIRVMKSLKADASNRDSRYEERWLLINTITALAF